MAAASLLATATGTAQDDRDVKARFEAAKKLHESGDVDAARARMVEIADSKPGDWQLAHSLARWLAEARNDFEGALPLARRAAALEPRSLEALNLNGICLLSLRRFEESEALYRGALERFGNDGLVHYGVGMSCGQQHKLLEAKASYARAIELDPENGLYRFSAGENLANLREYEAAERELRLAVQRKGHADAPWRLGEVLAQQGKDDEAEKTLIAAVNQGPMLSRWNGGLQLGLLYFERGRHGDAIGVLVKATEVRPEGRDAWRVLAQAQRALGRDAAAARSLRKYQELREQDDRAEDERLLGLIRAQLEGRAAKPGEGGEAAEGDDGG
jgi:Flp pilus assembly protein TadD